MLYSIRIWCKHAITCKRFYLNEKIFSQKNCKCNFFLNSKFTYSMIQGTFPVKGIFGGEKSVSGLVWGRWSLGMISSPNLRGRPYVRFKVGVSRLGLVRTFYDNEFPSRIHFVYIYLLGKLRSYDDRVPSLDALYKDLCFTFNQKTHVVK